ncbi:MAG TPA: tRNA (adenine-N1)-methyltransferase [Acidimicrobiales bacterium]|nr:tRNA (adenine-N1)-methyltransferase [Acidimicrobiales bacterium]
MGDEVDRAILRDGERVLLVDAKERQYLITLRAGSNFHTHMGIVGHDDLIGSPEGSTVLGTTGRRFLVVRPTLTDVVLKMPRGAQVIYPKDLAAIMVLADIAPGVTVLEAGVGSGALSMALLRAGAEVVGYELREDFAERAKANVEALVGDYPRYQVELRDVYEGIEERGLDRIVLDLPEPWRVLPHAELSMRPGGILCAYLPTINQTSELRTALARSAFGMASTVEVLYRTWHVESRSVRPDHRMVGHTGFLTTARLLVPETGATPYNGKKYGGAEDQDPDTGDDAGMVPDPI